MPFNFGAFAGGLSQGLVQGQKMQLEAEAHKLKAKMLKLQGDALEFDQGEKVRKAKEQQQQDIELGKYVDMATQGFPGQPPAPLQPGAEGPMPESGFQVPNRPATQQELNAQGLKTIPREHRYNIIQQQMKAGPGGMSEYQAQNLALQKARLEQRNEGGLSPQSRIWFGLVRENPGADMTTLTRKYNERLAEQGFATGAGHAAGGVAGGAGQTLGEPIAPMSPFAGQPPQQPRQEFPPANQVQPAPMPAGPVTPSIRDMSVGDLLNTGRSGQPAQQPGQSPALRAEAAKAGAKKTGGIQAAEAAPVPLGKEKDMVRLNEKGDIEYAPSGISPEQLRAGGFRTVDQPVLQSLNALAPARQALSQFNTNADALSAQSNGIGGSLSASAGALPGMAGALAQRAGASNTGDNMHTATLNFMQHYDRVVGGLRGASSPQLLQIMENRAPKPGMTPQQISNRKTYMNNVFHAMEDELKSVVSGKPQSDAVSKAVMADPDAQTAGPQKLQILKITPLQP